MAFKNLAEFIQTLKERNELIQIDTEVSADLEIAEITDRASKSQGIPNKALLFTNVKGYKIPLLINSMGSYRRMNIALGVEDIEEIPDRISSFLNPKVPDSFWGKLAQVPKIGEIASFFPRVVGGPAPCQDVVITNPQEPMLDKLPIIKCWPQDGGHFLTFGTVVTKNPNTDIRNIGLYRLQKYDNSTTGMHWHKHHDGALNQQDEKRNKKGRMEVAVVVGCDPSILYAASAPLPHGIDEYIFAGFLRKKPVSLVKCKTVDIEVPKEAEIVLEGYVDNDELRIEGPFGDHTGFYSLADLFPVFHITAVTHRRNPVYLTTIVGKPPQEDCYMGKATERIFLPLLRQIIPEIIDLNLPLEGVFHNCVIVNIDKRYPGHARKVMSAIWGAGQMMFSKYIIVVDKHVDVYNLSEVAWHVFNGTDPRRDTMIVDGPLDILDHATPLVGYGSKIGIDATKKWEGEGFLRDWPDEIEMSPEIKDLVDKKINQYNFFQ